MIFIPCILIFIPHWQNLIFRNQVLISRLEFKTWNQVLNWENWGKKKPAQSGLFWILQQKIFKWRLYHRMTSARNNFVRHIRTSLSPSASQASGRNQANIFSMSLLTNCRSIVLAFSSAWDWMLFQFREYTTPLLPSSRNDAKRFSMSFRRGNWRKRRNFPFSACSLYRRIYEYSFEEASPTRMLRYPPSFVTEISAFPDRRTKHILALWWWQRLTAARRMSLASSWTTFFCDSLSMMISPFDVYIVSQRKGEAGNQQKKGDRFCKISLSESWFPCCLPVSGGVLPILRVGQIHDFSIALRLFFRIDIFEVEIEII